jgi:hypothetical protein
LGRDAPQLFQVDRLAVSHGRHLARDAIDGHLHVFLLPEFLARSGHNRRFEIGDDHFLVDVLVTRNAVDNSHEFGIHRSGSFIQLSCGLPRPHPLALPTTPWRPRHRANKKVSPPCDSLHVGSPPIDDAHAARLGGAPSA